MKKFVFVLLCPFFIGLQSVSASEEIQVSSTEMTQQQTQELGVAHWRGARCGKRSDHKCWGRRVYDSCEKDSSHGYYGRCDNYGQRTPDVVCICR
ncbi:hypothetical protein [Bdellovibrio sp. HCB337]|uniref:hypothetical protein n=1 Tax=Bdellovibrio sp. HCB337 TaxID=3394358 RepID=UPI0039A541AB